ncbi:MAG: phosphoribosyl-AMP cyclohydrolase [Promethearchaeota archaeon]
MGEVHGLTFPDEIADELVSRLDFSKIPGNLVPVIAQDANTKEVLMLAFANELAIRETLRTGIGVYWSRSRGKLWRKGEESGHVQLIRDVRVDCYIDTVLYVVEQKVAACHTGYFTCFYRHLTEGGLETRGGLEKVFDPKEVYK